MIADEPVRCVVLSRSCVRQAQREQRITNCIDTSSVSLSAFGFADHASSGENCELICEEHAQI